MEHNPYAPPKAEVLDPTPTETVELASRGLRFANFVIDWIAVYLFSFIVGILLALARVPILNEPTALDSLMLGIAVWLLYYVPLETAFGRTLGKLITRTRVVTEDGEPPNILTVIGRTFTRLVPLEPF